MPATLVLPAMLALASTAATPPAPPPRLGLCAACHGREGRAAVPDAPHLAGQKAGYLFDAMRQYRDGRRDHAVMRTVLGPLDRAELEALAQWYAAQPPVGATSAP